MFEKTTRDAREELATKLAERVVVITGASSGLGRETAVQLAEAGCRLVLAARRGEDLDETVRLCRHVGGQAMAIVTDVTVEADVQALAQAALDTWGRIDVWINNAGVTVFATLEQAPFDDHRGVIETNVFGAMLGARAALPAFRAQGSGVLVNVGSILSEIGQPFVPSYAISKFALRGLTEALRVELADEPGIHACTILPFTIDTPHFESAGNERPTRARALPPMQSPEKVARAIVRLIARPRRQMYVPRYAPVGLMAHWLFPATTERLLLHALRRWFFDDVAQPHTSGNVHRPQGDGEATTHGLRPPLVGTSKFLAWNARELLRIGASDLGRWARSLHADSGGPPPRGGVSQMRTIAPKGMQ